jgi:hypothetical protein
MPSSSAAFFNRSNVDSRTLDGSRYARTIAASEIPNVATDSRRRSKGVGSMSSAPVGDERIIVLIE